VLADERGEPFVGVHRVTASRVRLDS